MRPCILLIFITSFQFCSACHLEFNNRSAKRYYYRRNEEERVIDSTIICSNVYSIGEIFYEYEPEEYDQFLKVTESNITTLHPNDFSKFSTIVKLYLSGIHIKEILPEAFTGLMDLKELYLDRNELTEIPKDTLNFLERLRVLNLSYNKICHIGKFMNTSSLEELRLQGNNISEIDNDAFDEYSLLRILDLSENPLETLKLPDNFSRLSVLNLHKTLIKDLGDWVDIRLSYWLVLNMTSNSITSVDFSKFPKAQTLDLSDNNITLLENCQNITAPRLHAQNNHIKYIKTSFWNLQYLTLSHNELEIINQTIFNSSRNIQELDLSFNKISVIEPQAFKYLSSLERLILSNNNISSLSYNLFDDQKDLKTLDLAFNNIKIFSVGNNLVSLRELDISHNNLSELQTFYFYSMQRLKILNISYNKLTTFDVKTLTSHVQLSSIFLEGNFWKCQKLVQIERAVNRPFFIQNGNSYDVENIKGIACRSDDFLENLDPSSAPVPFEELQKLINDSVKNSEFERFLDEDFKKSKFVKYLRKIGENVTAVSGEKKISAKAGNADSGVLVFGSVLQVVMCVLLIFIALAVFGVFKKINEKKNRTSSEAQLSPTET